jgi:hypothetical protein
VTTPHTPNPDFPEDLYQDFDERPAERAIEPRTGDDPVSLTGQVVQPYSRPVFPTAARGPVDEIMAMTSRDFQTMAQAVLHPDQTADLVHYALAQMPALHATPVRGAIEAYDPVGHRRLYVHPMQPVHHTPPVIEARAPIVDKWATNTALVSLSLSGAAWIAAAAVRLWAEAAAVVLQALQGLGMFALAAAVIFGLISVARKKAGATQIRQEVHNHIETKAVFAAKTNVDGSAHLHTR